MLTQKVNRLPAENGAKVRDFGACGCRPRLSIVELLVRAAKEAQVTYSGKRGGMTEGPRCYDYRRLAWAGAEGESIEPRRMPGGKKHPRLREEMCRRASG